MRSSEGNYVEVFGWTSARAIEEAHSRPAVQALWEEFSKVSEYKVLSALQETSALFPEFEAVSIED